MRSKPREHDQNGHCVLGASKSVQSIDLNVAMQKPWPRTPGKLNIGVPNRGSGADLVAEKGNPWP